MSAEILNSPPLSGSIDEKWFDAIGSCTWVRFVPEGDEPWAGVFGNGEGNKKAVVHFLGERMAFVVAKGQGYVVDVKDRTIKHKTEHDYLDAAMAIPERQIVIACDFCYLYAYSCDGLMWESDQVAMDGIIFDEAQPDRLLGKVWELDGWHSFTLWIDSRRFERGRLVTADRFEFD